MQNRIFLPIEASIVNPDDPSEVTMIADVSSVGVTRRTKNGQIINWTADILRGKAHTLVGKPVNVFLSDGRATTHSKNVVGTIIESAFDETTQKLRVIASLWKHYFPETIEKLRELARGGELQVSVEFAYSHADTEDGVTTPTDGIFLGVGIVDTGADLQNKVLVLASALQSDMEAWSKLENEIPVGTEEETTEILPMSFEWAGEQIADFLSSRGEEATVVGTYPSEFYYSNGNNTYQVPFTYTQSEGSLKFGEPVSLSVGDTTSLPNTSTLIWGVAPAEESTKETNMEELAEVQASLVRVQAEADDWKSKYETLEASVKDEREEREAEKRANDRIAEIEKISPYKDETLKTEHFELFKTADDKLFDAVKKLIMASVEPKGGIASESGVEAQSEDADPVQAAASASLPKWREELLAAYGQPKE